MPPNCCAGGCVTANAQARQKLEHAGCLRRARASPMTLPNARQDTRQHRSYYSSSTGRVLCYPCDAEFRRNPLGTLPLLPRTALAECRVNDGRSRMARHDHDRTGQNCQNLPLLSPFVFSI